VHVTQQVHAHSPGLLGLFAYHADVLLPLTGAFVLIQGAALALLWASRRRARRVEHDLAVERDRLELALKSSNQGAWDWDVINDVTVWSQEASRLMDLPERTETDGARAWADRLHPDDAAKQRVALADHLAGRGPYDLEVRVRMADGSYRWFRDRATALRDLDGRPVRMAGTITDVHDLVVAREARLTLESRFRAVFERHLHPMWIYHRPSGRMLAANEAALHAYGYTRDEFLALAIHALIHPDDRERLVLTFANEDPQQDHTGFWRHITRDGQALEVLISSIPIPWEGEPGVRLVTAIDLTESLRTQRALAERERLTRQIASAAPVGIYVYDLAASRNAFINDRINDMIGYTPAELQAMGRSMLETLMHPDDLGRYRAEHLPAILSAGDHAVLEFDYRMRHADGTWREFTSRDMVFSRNDAGLPVSIVGTCVDVTEQRAAQRGLRESQDRLALALRSGAMGVFDWDIAAGKITWSREHAEIWGMRLEDFDGAYRTFARRLHPDDLPELTRLVNLARDTRTEYVHEYRLIMPDGTIKWIQGRGGFVYDASGAPVRMTGLVTDITQRRAAQEALKASEKTTRALLKAIPDLMFRLDRSGRYVDYHTPDPSVLLVPPEQFIGRTMEEVLPAELLSLNREAFDRVVATGRPQTFEYEYARPNAASRIWEVRMVAADGDVLAVVRDITARRLAEREARQSQQRLSMLVSATPLGVLFVDPDFRIVEWNAGAERIFGFSAAEAVGRRADIIIPVSARPYVDDIYRQLLANTGGFRGTNKNLRKDGREIFCEWYNTPLVGADGQVLGVACVVEDVTEATLARRRQDRMLAELDHRVKNTLASVISLAEQTGRSAGDYADFLDKFRLRLRALARMHTILARSRWEGTDLRALIDTTLEAFGALTRSDISGPGVTLSPRTAQSLAMALNELATNAVKYGSLAEPSGRLDIAWTSTPADAAAGRDHPVVELLWTESGGPPVEPPARTGFGTQLIQGTIGFELGGTVDADFRPTGLHTRLRFPLKPDPEYTLHQPDSRDAAVGGAI
jgi:PAS domain S-box-containing protein